MAKYTITPWRTPADLLAVRNDLYAPSSPQNARGVSRTMAWKLRGNLPHAVESTALLVDARLHHSTGSSSAFALRAVYSAAFTRFVTGFCDIGRNRERALEPSSMLEIARQIGMPGEFVALRHEATHEDLPSLKRLVAACEQALIWLWEVYWMKLDERKAVGKVSEKDVDVAKIKSEAKRLFKEFRSSRRLALRKQMRSPVKDWDVIGELQTLCLDNDRALAAAASVLVDDKMLFPSDRKLGASLDGALMLWDDLLIAVAHRQPAFPRVLLTTLSTALDSANASNEDKEAHSKWLLHIATDESWGSVCEAASLDVKSQVIRTCCLHPGPWSLQLGDALLEASKDADFKELWSDILDASDIGNRNWDRGEAEETTMAEGLLEENALSDSSEHHGVAWRRALLEPRVPIGVVR